MIKLINYKKQEMRYLNEEIKLHTWVNNYLTDAIHFGIYKYGDILPSIAEVANFFNVSKKPVLQAFRILEKNHYIQMSRGMHSKVILNLDEVECYQYYTRYFLTRKKATEDLQQFRCIVLANFLNQALLLNHDYDKISKSIDNITGDIHSTGLKFVETLFSTFGNPLIHSLYSEINIFGKISFYKDIDNQIKPQIQSYQLKEFKSYINEILKKRIPYKESFQLFYNYFKNEDIEVNKRYSLIPNLIDVEEINFNWNLYKGRPRYIYNIATAILHDIIYQKYDNNQNLPRVLDLCKIYNAAESTLRRSLSLLKTAELIVATGGKGIKINYCENYNIAEILLNKDIRNLVVEGMQCLQIMHLTCNSVIDICFSTIYDHYKKNYPTIFDKDDNNTNWIRVINDYFNFIIAATELKCIKNIYTELKMHILWIYPFTNHLNKNSFQKMLQHSLCVLKYALEKKDKQLYIYEIQWILYIVLEEIRNVLKDNGIKEAIDLKMTPIHF